MKDLEKTLKALANRRRLAIIKHLKENNEASVGDIARNIKHAFKTTSRHLSILAAIDIVDKEQKGSLVFYYLSRVQKPIVKHTIDIL